MSRPPPDHGVPTNLAQLCAHTARNRLSWAAVLLGAGLLHALSHGAVAWTAALLGRAIVQDVPDHFATLAASPVHLAVMGLGAVIAKGVFGVLASLAQTRLAGEAGQEVRDRTVQALLQAGPHAPVPTTIARIVSRVREAERAVQFGPFAALRAVAQVIPIVAGLAILSPTLTLLAGLVLVPFAIALSVVRQRWRKLHETSMSAADQVHEEMDDLVRHLDLWRTYGTGERVRTVLHRLGKQAVRTRVHSDALGVAISSANEVLGAGALLAVLFVASIGFVEVDGAGIVAFIALFFMAYRPLRDLGDARTAWLRGREALAVLASLPAPSPGRGACRSFGPLGNQVVRVDALGVPGRTPTVSFSLRPGTMVALAGATGAGKTTLIRALLGLEPDGHGRVTIGDAELPSGQVGPSVRPFAWVPQDAPVVSGSLEENLRVAGAEVSRAWAHLSALGAEALGRSLHGQLLGAGGRALSGGERRWVSLARALATGLPVLLLDEPTVGLDQHARAVVLGILQRAKGHRTLVVATHDVEVLALADEIVNVA